MTLVILPTTQYLVLSCYRCQCFISYLIVASKYIHVEVVQTVIVASKYIHVDVVQTVIVASKYIHLDVVQTVIVASKYIHVDVVQTFTTFNTYQAHLKALVYRRMYFLLDC